MPTRRLILVTGSASVLVAGVGAGWWKLTAPARAAREPWRTAETGFDDPRLDILAYAILAPSAHNMQPWRIALASDNAFDVYCDGERLLPRTDPPGRQTTISFGCFLELCRMASAELGYRSTVTLFPDGAPVTYRDGTAVARVVLRRDTTVERDPLFGFLLQRRTCRLPYDMARPVDAKTLGRLRECGVPGVVVDGSSDAQRVAGLRALATDAWEVEWNEATTRRESVEVTHVGRDAVNARPYGISLDDRLPSTLGRLGLMSAAALDDPGSAAYRGTEAFYAKAIAGTPSFVWMSTGTNDRRAQLEAGRAWVRIQLIATAQGLSFHPLSQALQEFPAMAGHYQRAHAMLAPTPGATVQMLARVGYGPAIDPSPRESLVSRLLPQADA